MSACTTGNRGPTHSNSARDTSIPGHDDYTFVTLPTNLRPLRTAFGPSLHTRPRALHLIPAFPSDKTIKTLQRRSLTQPPVTSRVLGLGRGYFQIWCTISTTAPTASASGCAPHPKSDFKLFSGSTVTNHLMPGHSAKRKCLQAYPFLNHSDVLGTNCF